MWHENPLTKFDDNTNYFVCFFVFSNVCSLNLWFASVIDKFDLGYIKNLFQTTLLVQTTCMKNSVWNLFKKYNKL